MKARIGNVSSRRTITGGRKKGRVSAEHKLTPLYQSTIPTQRPVAYWASLRAVLMNRSTSYTVK